MSDVTPPEDREIDPANLSARKCYALLTSIVVPRPIAWVSSRATDGTLNLAPHSYFMVLSTDPPILGFVSVGEKDTLRNIQATGDYVINVASEHLAEQINLTAADFPPEQSEFTWAGLTPRPSHRVATPGVAEAAVSLEMRLREVTPYGNVPHYLIVGDMVHLRITEAVMRDDRVAPDLLRAIGRLGGPTYSRTLELFDLQRPTYAGLKQATNPESGL